MPPPPLQPRPQPPWSPYASSNSPAMENHETECYILQSLELLADLATTPASQYCGPEIRRSAQAWAPHGSLPDDVVASPSLLLTAPIQRYDPWEASSSFQQVYQRTVEGQHQQEHQQLQPKPSFDVSSFDSPSSSALVPANMQFNHYHSNFLPHSLSVASSSDSQPKPEDRGLKRLRNTAASARFRAKKKRREQLVEQNARETRETVNKLEHRVTELETENRWLKGLIMDKSEATIRKELEVTASERKGSAHKDGVGTEGQ